MAPKRDYITQAYNALEDILREDYQGIRQDFDRSLDRTIRQMKSDLADIEERGEWNGIAIRDPSQTGEKVEMALGRVMETATAVMGCVGETGWTTDFKIPEDRQDRMGGTRSINLLEAGEKLSEAVNHWLAFVGRHPEYGVGLPLASNHDARQNPAAGIDRLSDVFTLGFDGYEAKSFLRNADITTPRRNAAGPAGPAPSVTVAPKP